MLIKNELYMQNPGNVKSIQKKGYGDQIEPSCYATYKDVFLYIIAKSEIQNCEVKAIKEVWV